MKNISTGTGIALLGAAGFVGTRRRR